MFRKPFQYLELTGRETEFVALSRDTTESDLKQRREIRDGTAHYVDQVRVSQSSTGCTEIAEIIPYLCENVCQLAKKSKSPTTVVRNTQ